MAVRADGWRWRAGRALAGAAAEPPWRRSGASGSERSDVLKELDDWCPTQPKKIKLPPGSGPIPEPEPHPDWFTDYQIGFVTRAAMASAEFDGTRLGEYLGKAIDRTVAAMESPNMR